MDQAVTPYEQRVLDSIRQMKDGSKRIDWAGAEGTVKAYRVGKLLRLDLVEREA